MANEKRLIDVIGFRRYLEEIRQGLLDEDTSSSNFAAEVIETVQDEYLAKAPTVDAVEVVRCKNCKKREVCRTTNVWAVAPGDEWFCADGERRDNA